MKNVKIFCCKCQKPIFQRMLKRIQKSTTVYEANNSKCSDCRMNYLVKLDTQE